MFLSASPTKGSTTASPDALAMNAMLAIRKSCDSFPVTLRSPTTSPRNASIQMVVSPVVAKSPMMTASSSPMINAQLPNFSITIHSTSMMDNLC